MSPAIETRRLSRRFGDFWAVDRIDLLVERGTFYGFLGPNGAGKSTTIKMLTGLLAPTKGEIRVLGRDMRDPKESLDAKKQMGVIAENLSLHEQNPRRCSSGLEGAHSLLDEHLRQS